MATATKPYVGTNGSVAAPTTGTRSGWVTFAGIVFLVAAFANIVWGLAALDNKEFLSEGGLLYSTLETWGWIALGWGAVVAIGGILLLARVRSGPAIGIVLAAISCFFWLFALPVFPFFAMTVLLIDVLVIYGLAVYGLPTE